MGLCCKRAFRNWLFSPLPCLSPLPSPSPAKRRARYVSATLKFMCSRCYVSFLVSIYNLWFRFLFVLFGTLVCVVSSLRLNAFSVFSLSSCFRRVSDGVFVECVFFCVPCCGAVSRCRGVLCVTFSVFASASVSALVSSLLCALHRCSFFAESLFSVLSWPPPRPPPFSFQSFSFFVS